MRRKQRRSGDRERKREWRGGCREAGKREEREEREGER